MGKTPKTKAEDAPRAQINVRLSPELFAAVQERAAKEGRTMANLLAFFAMEAMGDLSKKAKGK